MNSTLQAALEKFVRHQQLPSSYLQTVEQWFLPLAETVLGKASVSRKTLVVGISGCQGSGKTTLASLLVLLLRELMGLRSINLSMDDFYFTHAQRQHLGRTIHPLLATRGVPGTHDVELALKTLNSLSTEGEVAIPRFNKVVDDRFPQEQWPRVLAPLDVVVLEGWCLGIPAQAEAELVLPLNSLETQEDCDGRWRRYVNQQISSSYSRWWDTIDFLVMLKAPHFGKVYEWRQNQENQLAAVVEPGADAGHRLMSPEQLQHFIQHYERLTRHGLAVLPSKADIVFGLTDQQTIAGKLKG